VDQPRPPRRLLQRRPDLAAELAERVPQRGRRNPGGGQVDAVEPFRLVPDGRRAAQAHVFADRPHRLQRSLDVEPRPGQRPGQAPPAEAGRALPAQVDPGEHLASVAARAELLAEIFAAGGAGKRAANPARARSASKT